MFYLVYLSHCRRPAKNISSRLNADHVRSFVCSILFVFKLDHPCERWINWNNPSSILSLHSRGPVDVQDSIPFTCSQIVDLRLSHCPRIRPLTEINFLSNGCSLVHNNLHCKFSIEDEDGRWSVDGGCFSRLRLPPDRPSTPESGSVPSLHPRQAPPRHGWQSDATHFNYLSVFPSWRGLK